MFLLNENPIPIRARNAAAVPDGNLSRLSRGHAQLVVAASLPQVFH